MILAKALKVKVSGKMIDVVLAKAKRLYFLVHPDLKVRVTGVITMKKGCTLGAAFKQVMRILIFQTLIPVQ